MATWIIYCFIILSIFCIFSIIKLFNRGEKEYAKSAVSTYATFSVIFICMLLFSIKIPSYIIFLTILTIFIACFVGHYLSFYTKSNTFDRYLHGFGSFSFSLFFYCIVDNYINTGSSKIFQSIFIFLLGNTLGVFFELIEAMHDKSNPIKSQKGLMDTNTDMLFNLIGSVLAGLFAYIWLL